MRIKIRFDDIVDVGEIPRMFAVAVDLAFKPETDDMREAPSIEIIRGLLERGANVRAYDPVAMTEAAHVLPQIQYAVDEYEAVKDADALV